MKFITSNQTWNRGITAVQNAVGSAISNPIVENIHISCDEGKIWFLATNLNLTIQCEGEANVEEKGEIVLPSKVIINVVRDLPQGDVQFEAESENVKLSSGEFFAKLKGQPGELFPPFVILEEGEDIQLDIRTLKDMIRKTIFATSAEKSRYELDGVKFELKDKKLNCIATDGRRLSVYVIEDDKIPAIETSVLIPSKTLHEVQNALPDEGEVIMRLAERKVQFKCGDTTIVSNLLIDNFPQYDRIIPPESDTKIKINRENFASAVKRASNLTSVETNMVILKLEKNTIEIFGEREEVGGEGRDKIDAEYDGETMEMRYNFRFLVDFLRIIQEETVILDLNDPRKPGLFKGEGNDAFKYVLMPMRPPEKDEEE